MPATRLGSGMGEHRKYESRKHESTKKTSKNDSFDDQGGGVEIQEKADVEAGGLHVGPYLRVVDVFETLAGFQLDDDLAADNQIQSVQADIHLLKKCESLSAAQRQWCGAAGQLPLPSGRRSPRTQAPRPCAPRPLLPESCRTAIRSRGPWLFSRLFRVFVFSCFRDS